MFFLYSTLFLCFLQAKPQRTGNFDFLVRFFTPLLDGHQPFNKRICRPPTVGVIHDPMSLKWQVELRCGLKFSEEVPQEPELPKFAKRVVYQRSKNNHFGIYEYIQVNLAYSSNRMASNRLTRTQVEQIYRTNKIATAFEPMKVDDIIETINHFSCVQHMVGNIAAPLTQSFIKKLHYLLTYGTYSDRKQKSGSGEYRSGPHKIGVPPREINRALGELIKEYEKQPADFERILDFHVRFERIHPFDGPLLASSEASCVQF